MQPNLKIDLIVEPKPMGTIERQVLDILNSYSGGVSRLALQGIIFKTESDANADRRIRRAISSLRNRGFIIVSNSHGRGYQLTTDPAKVRHYYNEQIKRARAIMRTANHVRRAYGLKDQLSLSN